MSISLPGFRPFGPSEFQDTAKANLTSRDIQTATKQRGMREYSSIFLTLPATTPLFFYTFMLTR
ncbi:MAG TPA: hypothetical protein P5270_05385 [Victivallales bacterium]|nr:hypothetical protein [Victivallales bacterium]